MRQCGGTRVLWFNPCPYIQQERPANLWVAKLKFERSPTIMIQ